MNLTDCPIHAIFRFGAFVAVKTGDSVVPMCPMASMVSEICVENIGELEYPISRLEECTFQSNLRAQELRHSNLAKWNIA